jgi:nucleoid-associated protein YgaU
MGAKLTAAFLILFALGCATQKKLVPADQATVTITENVAPLPTPAPTPAAGGEYRIKPGDCLWTITENRGTSPFLWPSLWKANRDYIQDPEKIETGEWLQFPEGVSTEEMNWALQAAYDWPDRKAAKRRGAPGAK